MHCLLNSLSPFLASTQGDKYTLSTNELLENANFKSSTMAAYAIAYCKSKGIVYYNKVLYIFKGNVYVQVTTAYEIYYRLIQPIDQL